MGEREAKAQWFVGPSGWRAKLRELDFRVGGRAQLIGAKANGFVSRFDARYHEIVPNKRIVYVYDMYVNDRQLSTSLATIGFEEQAAGTALIITEQGVFPNGLEDARSREHGTHGLIDQLERALQRQSGG